MEIRMCDRCGKETDWDIDHKAGSCSECGIQLCGECAVLWSDYGECKDCVEKFECLKLGS